MATSVFRSRRGRRRARVIRPSPVCTGNTSSITSSATSATSCGCVPISGFRPSNLYHLIPATPKRSRALFLDYVKTANELHDRAQWYNELFSNCTTNVRLHIKDIGSARPWDWQILINGFIAERAYELKAIDTSLPFAELRRLSYIDYRARDADDLPTFSSLIRKGLPGMP